ncbi:MAG: hypothetical protein NTV84_11460 [Methanoregula sp.]|nr:hypothetical protein [Methanoregula sp.]
MDIGFKKKWGIMFKAFIVMLILLVPRTIIDIYGFDTVPINPVVGAFITGARSAHLSRVRSSLSQSFSPVHSQTSRKVNRLVENLPLH